MIRPVAHAFRRIGFGKQVSNIVGYIDPVHVIVESVHHQMRVGCPAACLSPETYPCSSPTYYLRPTTYQTLTPFVFSNIPAS